MSNTNDNLDSFGATLQEGSLAQTLPIALLGGVKTDNGKIEFEDNIFGAAMALNWHVVGRENIDMLEVGPDQLGVTDGKTVLIGADKIPLLIQKQSIGNDLIDRFVVQTMAQEAFAAAKGHETESLKQVSVENMDVLLGELLSQNYPNGEWKERLGYDERNISHFGIIEAKEALDNRNQRAEVHHGSFIGDFQRALRRVIAAKPMEPAPESFSGENTLFDDSYTDSTESTQALLILAHNHIYLDQVGQEDSRQRRCTAYAQWLVEDEHITKGDIELLIDVASMASLVSNIEAPDPGQGKSSWLEVEPKDKPRKMKP